MRAKLILITLAALLSLALPVSAQTCVSLTNTTYTQDFNTLANTGTSSALPTGWFFSESGTNANATYTAGTGSGNAGDTYSFGAAGSTDRAFGTLQSGTLIPAIGACFVNNSGSSIEVTIGYTGEQWRLGQSGRGADRLDFQYSTDATALNNGTWTDFNALDFSSPIAIGTAGALDGNAAANRTQFNPTALTGVTIPNGGRLFIRWTDFNATGSDDGLGVDDFSLSPGVTSNLSGLGTAAPATIARASQSTLLTVAVTPAGAPPSTGIAVKVDLSSIGGSATQVFLDDGVNGDVTAGDNIFSFQTTAAFASLPGVKSLPVTITDAQARSASASIALTVTCSFSGLIGPIQGSGSRSPYEGCLISTTGIVTGKKSNGFFMQSAPDGDPNTSDGVFVFTSSSPAVNQGDSVQVSGTVQEFSPSADPNSPPATEIAFGPTVAVLSSGNALPAAITLTVADTNPAGGIDVLEKYEGMRVHVDTLNVVAPTGGSVTEVNATSASNGVFYGVLPGIARPFREAGVVVGDPLPAGSPCCVPRFDNNPERIRVDTKSAVAPGAPPPPPVTLEVTTGATVTNLTGPLDYGFRAYTIMQEVGSTPVATGNVSFTAVPAPLSTEVTVGSFNMERFFDTTDDPSISDVALTPAAFANRLAKASLVIRNVLRYPDVIGVEEMENLSTLQSVANKVNTDAATAGDPNPNYQAFLVEGNDIGGIDVGFLVKSLRISVIDVTQYGLTDMYANPGGGTALTWDRPPLVLRATAALPGGTSLPFTAIVNHLRSLDSVDDPADGPRVRAKREAEAEFLARLIQDRQIADPTELIISVGDYNAFEVSDGYVDVMGAIKGTPVPANQVVLASPTLVNPPLTDLLGTLPPAQQYSYVFDGDAQTLDHELVTQSLVKRVNRLAYARNDADFPETFRNDPARPERISDHDMAVAYLNLAPVADITAQFTVTTSGFLYSPVTRQYSGTIKLVNNGAATNGPVSVVLTNLTPGATLLSPSGTYLGSPDLVVANTAGGMSAGQTITIPVKFTNTSSSFIQFVPKVYSGPLN